jgi:hypothetical protein
MEKKEIGGNVFHNCSIGHLGGHIDTLMIGCSNIVLNKWGTAMNDEMEEKQPDGGLTVSESQEETVTVDKKKRGGGRKVTPLFMNGEQEKDESMTAKMAELFTGFLKEHHSASSGIMETKKDNYVAKAFVAFYCRWAKDGRVERTVNGQACYRFLNGDCHLDCATTGKAYGDWIKGKIDRNDVDVEIDMNVDDYLRERN